MIQNKHNSKMVSKNQIKLNQISKIISKKKIKKKIKNKMIDVTLLGYKNKKNK